MSRTGIGASYVQQQLNSGRSLASIQQEAARNGWEVGAKAQEMFRAPAPAPAPAPSYSPPPQAAAARTGIGATYVQQQLNAGKSMGQIQAEAQRNGWEIGEKAQQMFSNATNAASGSGVNQYGAPAAGRFFDPSNYSGAEDAMGSGGFGLEALNRARKAGFNDAQIRTTLAGAGMTIGPAAADALGVMAGQTFYTGQDGKARPDRVQQSYLGQAGTRDTRPVLLPAGAYNSAQNKPFDSNYVWVAGGTNDADVANLYTGKKVEGGTYGTYSDPEWSKYIGENGYLNPSPSVDERGNAIADLDWKPQEYYEQKKGATESAINSSLSSGGAPSAPSGSSLIASSADAGSGVSMSADLGSEVTGQSDVPMMQTKVQAVANNDTSKKLASNTGYLTGGSLRRYYASRFA